MDSGVIEGVVDLCWILKNLQRANRMYFEFFQLVEQQAEMVKWNYFWGQQLPQRVHQ